MRMFKWQQGVSGVNRQERSQVFQTISLKSNMALDVLRPQVCKEYRPWPDNS